MSITNPTTAELTANVVAQVEIEISQAVPLLPRTFTRVLAKALAGVYILLYKYVGYGILQSFVATASDQDTNVNGVVINPLQAWGSLIGAGLPVAATQTQLLVDINVITQTGSLPAYTQFLGANGVTYLSTAAVLLNAATVQATVIASSDQSGGNGAGAIGNLADGSALSIANAPATVSAAATVDSTVVTGANAEATSVYRQRVIDYFQKRPQGGALADYELWGEEVAGIINVYPYRSACPGQVDLYVEATAASSGSSDGIPTTSQLEAVLASVELDSAGLATRRPVGALVNALPITRSAFDVEVFGLLVDDPAGVQADIATALTSYLALREPYIEGLSSLPRLNRITANAIGGTIEDIVDAAGGTVNDVIVKYLTSSVNAYTLGVGERAKLGAVTYIS